MKIKHIGYIAAWMFAVLFLFSQSGCKTITDWVGGVKTNIPPSILTNIPPSILTNLPPWIGTNLPLWISSNFLPVVVTNVPPDDPNEPPVDGIGDYVVVYSNDFSSDPFVAGWSVANASETSWNGSEIVGNNSMQDTMNWGVLYYANPHSTYSDGARWKITCVATTSCEAGEFTLVGKVLRMGLERGTFMSIGNCQNAICIGVVTCKWDQIRISFSGSTEPHGYGIKQMIMEVLSDTPDLVVPTTVEPTEATPNPQPNSSGITIGPDGIPTAFPGIPGGAVVQ